MLSAIILSRSRLTRLLCSLGLLGLLALPAAAQTQGQTIQGYLYQTAITQESYLLTNPQELQSFVAWLSPVLPYKTLPAPPNPDPFLKGFTVDFEQNVIAVAVARDRISDPPSYLGTVPLEDGTRQARFELSAPDRSKPSPFGWAVYTAVVLPREQAPTTVLVRTLPSHKRWP
jgi:hypothetical protein